MHRRRGPGKRTPALPPQEPRALRAKPPRLPLRERRCKRPPHLDLVADPDVGWYKNVSARASILRSSARRTPSQRAQRTPVRGVELHRTGFSIQAAIRLSQACLPSPRVKEDVLVTSVWGTCLTT